MAILQPCGKFHGVACALLACFCCCCEFTIFLALRKARYFFSLSPAGTCCLALFYARSFSDNIDEVKGDARFPIESFVRCLLVLLKRAKKDQIVQREILLQVPRLLFRSRRSSCTCAISVSSGASCSVNVTRFAVTNGSKIDHETFQRCPRPFLPRQQKRSSVGEALCCISRSLLATFGPFPRAFVLLFYPLPRSLSLSVSVSASLSLTLSLLYCTFAQVVSATLCTSLRARRAEYTGYLQPQRSMRRR